MDLLDLGCACLELPYLKPFMDGVGLLGRGVTAPVIGLNLIAFGYYRNRPTLKRTGWAVLISLAMTALLVNLLKILLQMPRPTPRSGYGFPSGDSGTAFSFAAVIVAAFPGLAPLVFSLATLATISRLYFRAHYVLDVLGGAVIGIVCGTYLARRILQEQPARPGSWSARATWAGIGVLTLVTGAFFFRLETTIAQHRIINDSSLASTSLATEIDFGTDSARPFLLNGWSPNKTWRQPTLSINWVVGRDAALKVPLASGRSYRVRFRVYPYRPTGFTCQWIDIKVNDQLVQRVYLEQDWNAYEVSLPQRLVKAGGNHVELHSAYADAADWHGINPERKALSVAFDTMQFIPDQAK